MLIFKKKVEKPSHQELIMCFDSWIVLTCKRIVTNNQNGLDNQFTLVHALEEGYFSDLELCAANGHTVSNKPKHTKILDYIFCKFSSSFRYTKLFSPSVLETLTGIL